ncbi:MAG: ribonuclease HI [Candidatus Shikimatogenerans bostrichidophilus]|nr:MAG: ribonuclease HI [Candidatus Shikimatogenerans bostrichidophilus]
MKYLRFYYNFINNLNLYINIYTDGSSKGNPGPGGVGFIILYITYFKEYSYKFRYTTNNRMELYSIIFSLKTINKLINYKNLLFNIYSDSKYIINTIKYNYKIKKNYDLWNKLFKFNINKINFFWVKGHNNNYYNEKCNLLANNIINKKKYKIDFFYENLKK